MKHTLSWLAICMLMRITGYAQQTNTRNYIIQRIYKQSGANPDDVSKVATQVRYFDGLGRPAQIVTVAQNPAGQDFVESLEYDAAGRIVKKYLPYAASGNGAFHGSATTEAGNWYSANSAGLLSSDLGKPYHETFFEPAPTNRISGERAPGNKSNASVIKQKVNTANQVNRYDYDQMANTIVQVGAYAAGTLTYKSITDEQGGVTNEFTDLLGQVVCRQVIAGAGNVLSTYYIYDDAGLLRGVLQPNYQDVPSLTDHAFTYDYDERGRMTIKRVPGGGTTELVYDKHNRLALSRDPNQLSRGVWAFTKYDALDRPILTGEIVSNATRQSWATNVDANTEHHEERSNGVVQGYTLDKMAPKTATEANLLTITFYDDYAFSKVANLNYNAVYYPTFNSNVKGQVTGKRARMLPGNGAMGGWLTSVMYYDPEYRPIQIASELYDLGASCMERISTQYKYDLAPVMAEQKTEQLLPGNVAHTHTATFEYDHADRLLSIKEKVMSGNKTKELFTAGHRYNALGQQQSRWQHSVDNTHYLRKTSFTYNIRSWQTEGRTVYKEQDNGPEQNIFGYNLSYANGNNYTNGNISQMQWLNKNEASYSKGLNFAYDGASRITGSTGVGGYADTEGSITYDKNGNVKTLVRAGMAVDNLTYIYAGNRLSSVNDGSGSNLGVKSGASSFGYDGNGNMTMDGNRGATLTYNYLNLPKTITLGGKTATYDYDAAGAKHKYLFDTLTLKYAGRFQYRQIGNANNPYRISLSEGQAVFRNNNISFEYYLKDHLGNVRLVFDEKGQTLQRTDYYTFGLEIDRNNPAQQPKVRNGYNRYLYNEKELQVGTGLLDYGARMYMPELGRAAQIDPMCDRYYPWSGYGWVMDNPLKFTDPTGMLSTHTDENGNVVAVYDDGDLGVYKHDGNKREAQKAVMESYRRDNTSAGGEKMGESLHALSFANQNLYNESRTVRAADIKIDFGSTTLTDRIQGIINSDPSVTDYFNRAGTGGDWDVKAHVSNGSLLYGKYASPRDAGNFAAGVVAESSGMEPLVQYGFGAYNLTGNSKPWTVAVTVGVALLTRMNPALGFGTAYLIGKYGEDELSQRSIDIGKEFIRGRR